MENTILEQFEAWAATHYVLMELSTEIEDGEYIEPDMQYAWESWQASRAVAIVQFPKRDQSAEGIDWYDGGATYDQCRAAVEAAGIKVNP